MTAKRLYATATEARWAVDDAAYADGRQPDLHVWLGAICDEAECYCGVQMPLDEDGQPRLTFEEWIEYHDRVLLDTLDADERAYAEAAELARASSPEPTGPLTDDEIAAVRRLLDGAQ